MGKKYRLFTNEALGEVLCCVLSPEEEPEAVERKGDLAILKKEDKPVGYNLFAYKGGNPLDAINEALAKAGEEKLSPEDEAGKTVVVKIAAVSEHPLDQKLSILDLENGESVVTEIKGLKAGDSIAYLPVGGIAPDGELSKIEKVRNVDSSGKAFAL